MLNEKNFREAFEPLHASDETVKEVLKMTEKRENRSTRWVLRTALAAAMALVLIVGIAVSMPFAGSAAPEEPRPVYENSKAILTALYGENYDRDVAAKYVEPYIYPVSGTLTYEGYTVELEAAAFDAITGSGLLYYSLEIPEGTKDYWEYANQILDANETGIYEDESTYPEPMLNHLSRRVLDLANSTDTKLYIVEPFLFREELFADIEGITKKAIEAGLRDQLNDILAGAANDRLRMTFMIPGVGDGLGGYMEIPLDPLADMDWISLDGGNFRISPLGMYMAMDPYHIDYEADGKVWEDIFEILDMRIHYADGTEFVVVQKEWFDEPEKGLWPVVSNRYYCLMGIEGANDMEYCATFFKGIIDVENVVSIELNGTHYYVDDLN